MYKNYFSFLGNLTRILLIYYIKYPRKKINDYIIRRYIIKSTISLGILSKYVRKVNLLVDL